MKNCNELNFSFLNSGGVKLEIMVGIFFNDVTFKLKPYENCCSTFFFRINSRENPQWNFYILGCSTFNIVLHFLQSQIKLKFIYIDYSSQFLISATTCNLLIILLPPLTNHHSFLQVVHAQIWFVNILVK
jgi:hypothetical protein